jgi:hypothetical protein
MEGRVRSCQRGMRPCPEVRTREQSEQPMACPDCHALTDDLPTHEHWHTRLVHDIAVALAKENERRDAATAR